jgi:hypothetical protein
VHGQVCINSSIESILEQVDLPLIMLCMISRSYSPLADRSRLPLPLAMLLIERVHTKTNLKL